MKKINLGCGTNHKKDFINIDITSYKNVDEVIDLRILPWKWESNSIDEIFMSHLLEHFFNQVEILKECHRILKPNGILTIIVPHCTNMRATGDMGHYRGYSIKTFHQYLCNSYYWFNKPAFRIISQKITYLGFSKCLWLNIITFITLPIEWLINLCPELFERFWWGYVGGASQVEWIGKKI